jgi:hypothetical protein
MLMTDIKVKNSRALLAAMLVYILMVHSGCRHKESYLSPAKYVTWVEDPRNGLNVKKEIGDITFSLQYQPAELMVANRYKDPYLTTQTLNREVNKYRDFEYYTLRITNNHSNTDILAYKLQHPNDYYDREKYYCNDFGNDIYLVKDQDTISCTLFNYIPSYGIAPYIDFLIAFPRAKNNKIDAENNRLLVVDDKILGNGIVKLEIKKDNINNIPTIITY